MANLQEHNWVLVFIDPFRCKITIAQRIFPRAYFFRRISYPFFYFRLPELVAIRPGDPFQLAANVSYDESNLTPPQQITDIRLA